MLRAVVLSLLLVASLPAISFKTSGGGDTPIPDRMELQRRKEASQIDSFIRALHQSGYFNGTLLVARKGVVVYHESMGWADLAKKDSVNNELPYQMASVTKPITSAAIMLLVQRGEISLDDKITKYFPELMIYHKVKVSHLLNHTSGIPDYIYRLPAAWKKKEYMTNDDLIRFYATKKIRTTFGPGYRYEYSNTNYALLASLVERVTDQKFPDFVKAEIFDPLGMTHSYIFTPERDTMEGKKIKGYRWTGRAWLEYGIDYRNGIVGDKGMFATADDMLRFAKAFDEDNLWCNETCESIFKPTYTYGKGESEYGLGWRIREWDSSQVVLHYGFWNSFRTGLIEFPESDVTFVILNNFTGASGGKVNNRDVIIRELMKIMFPVETTEPMQVEISDKVDEGTESEGGGEGTPPTLAE